MGTCGFPRSRGDVFRELDAVEIQETFYNLPPPEKARGLRSEAPPGIVFSVKAWQVVTHPSTSPTMRRLRSRPPGDPERYGLLRPTRENLEAWDAVEGFARELGARFVVLQTPPTMPYTPEWAGMARDFFSAASRKDLKVCWEPRGAWASEGARKDLCSILEDAGIVHVVDLLRRSPCPQPWAPLYTRLHGLGGGEVNYGYKYKAEDLEELLSRIRGSGREEALAMFNNAHMWDDARAFRELALGPRPRGSGARPRGARGP